MPDVFDYDVFLSFSSKDEGAVKPIWQELSQNGLRVFWSDETLKQNVGQSFFEVIQEALINSRHLVLLMSANASESRWVKLEYTTFFNECFMSGNDERRLIVYPIGGYDTGRLPPFLKTLQIARSVKAIIPLLGGVDIEALKRENAELREQLDAANGELQRLRDEASALRRLNADIDQKLTAADQQISDLKAAATKALPTELETVEARTAVAAPPPRGHKYPRKIGHVVNYFAQAGVVMVNLYSQLSQGDRVRIKGHTTDFEQVVTSLRVNDAPVLFAGAGEVTFKTESRCRVGDDVYKIG